MADRNTPRKALRTWKQIAAFLGRSERTVRRWEATEGLPVHRRRHQRQDSVFAYRHEIEAWSRVRTEFPGDRADEVAAPSLQASLRSNGYLTEHDAITRTMHCYIAGARAGEGDIMRPAFHRAATMSGYCLGVEYAGPIEHVFEWVDQNGPAPDIRPHFARIEIIHTIAVVHLEVHGWTGKLVGGTTHASDIFTLLRQDGDWKITHKLFHWHTG